MSLLPEKPDTAADAETVLLQRLEAADSPSDFSRTLWQLVHFYNAIERQDLRAALIESVKDRVEKEISSEERIRLYTEGAEPKSSDAWIKLESLYPKHKTLILRILWIVYALSVAVVFYKSYFVNNESLIFSIISSMLKPPLIVGFLAIGALAATQILKRWNEVKARTP